ncbi:hypothetical protein [Weissella confusa]|uniref:hypothetical protein n=1 Tax=Weissella confusa TaxID=1583 RepID=UPI0021A48371|nr:hypothetical protein [Weissella confusa]MCT2910894.1 hypothetical protein [Weissella confusa]
MSELRKCLVPGCEKTVVEEGYYFCGQHERDFINKRDKAGRYTGVVAGLAASVLLAVQKLKK